MILGLLPNYIEQGDSSLIHMVTSLMNKSQSKYSKFILGNPLEISGLIHAAKREEREVLLFGVSYSLLDLIDLKIDLSGCNIIMTGEERSPKRTDQGKYACTALSGVEGLKIIFRVRND